MRKIIINGRFLIHRVTGVERYAREILSVIDQIANPGEFELAIPPEVKTIPKYNKISVVRVGRMPNRLWEHISFPAYTRKQKGLSLNLCNVAPLSNPGIVSIFDVKIRQKPEFFNKLFVLWYRLLFYNETKRAKLIFTDSYSAKSDILSFYRIPEDRIVVAPCGWQHYDRIEYNESSLQKYGLEKNNYYFAIGSLDPNKNFRWIAETAVMNKNQVFAIAGSINHSIFSKDLGMNCPSNLKLLGYISDEEAKTLMRDCKAFLFPSFCEGFGMPPLEALSAGAKAIVVSDIPVMHELFENEFDYINPQIPCDEIIVHTIPQEAKDKILNKYSWEKSAENIYKNCIILLK